MLKSSDVIPFLYEHYLAHGLVSTDSRRVPSQSLFFALKGARFDGNTFAEQALSQGAAYAIIDNEKYKKDERYILVEDVLPTLQQLAHHHRKQLDIPVLAITGSSGKTTTKELIHAVLRCRYHTVATQGNLNNHIGVPLTLLAVDTSAEIAVIEMGANHVGEIALLCEIAMPTHGLITSIGHVHIEGFGSFEGVIKGKSELYDYLESHGGEIFVNAADPILSKVTQRCAQPIRYPRRQDFCHCELVEESPSVVYKSENGQVVTSHLLGHYHFYNIAAALCIAKYFEVDETTANQAITNYQPSNNRSQLIKKGSNTILLDAYNANLESVQGVIRALDLIPSARKVLILGDMAELGEETEAAHQTLVHLTTQANYQAVLLCGPQMIAAQKTNPEALYFPDKEALQSYLQQQNFINTAFLIKGSRSLQLETIVDHL
ncbi:MAG: UDP-N-acetylmuramoyl-tripeptide--D-alanyl-D-alanine ligase [Roseivirga sp.]